MRLLQVNEKWADKFGVSHHAIVTDETGQIVDSQTLRQALHAAIDEARGDQT